MAQNMVTLVGIQTAKGTAWRGQQGMCVPLVLFYGQSREEDNGTELAALPEQGWV